MEEKDLMDGLVERVHKEFPAITLKFSNSVRGELDTKDGKKIIIIGKKGESGKHPYFTLLHEIGHYVTHGSENKEKFFEDNTEAGAPNTVYNSQIVLMAEIDAWVWAYEECPSELREELLKYAANCLASYWVMADITGLDVKKFFLKEGISDVKYPPKKSKTDNGIMEFRTFMASLFGVDRPEPEVYEKPIMDCIIERAKNKMFFDKI